MFVDSQAEKVHDDAPEADPVEKQEEMDRMREHVMREFDRNNDRMLSLDEFEQGVNATEANKEQGWQVSRTRDRRGTKAYCALQSIEDKAVFSDQEFQQFSEKMGPVSTVESSEVTRDRNRTCFRSSRSHRRHPQAMTHYQSRFKTHPSLHRRRHRSNSSHRRAFDVVLIPSMISRFSTCLVTTYNKSQPWNSK